MLKKVETLPLTAFVPSPICFSATSPVLFPFTKTTVVSPGETYLTSLLLKAHRRRSKPMKIVFFYDGGCAAALLSCFSSFFAARRWQTGCTEAGMRKSLTDSSHSAHTPHAIGPKRLQTRRLEYFTLPAGGCVFRQDNHTFIALFMFISICLSISRVLKMQSLGRSSALHGTCHQGTSHQQLSLAQPCIASGVTTTCPGSVQLS